MSAVVTVSAGGRRPLAPWAPLDLPLGHGAERRPAGLALVEDGWRGVRAGTLRSPAP